MTLVLSALFVQKAEIDAIVLVRLRTDHARQRCNGANVRLAKRLLPVVAGEHAAPPIPLTG
jgi:hypothetical protein